MNTCLTLLFATVALVLCLTMATAALNGNDFLTLVNLGLFLILSGLFYRFLRKVDHV